MESSHKQKLIGAVVKILRPLIHLLIRHEVTHAELTELIRQTYVEVAYDAFSIPQREMSISRAAVLTGLSRKEVVRLREALEHNETVIKESPNRAQRVVHGWLNDIDFLNRQKHPRDLLIKSNEIGEKKTKTFQDLVRRYSGDITYGAVLDELNRIGLTEQLDDNTVRLINRAYVPRKDELEQIRILSMCVSDLFSTAVYNVAAPDNEKRFQRQVVYTGIEDSLAEKFQTISSEKASEFIEALNTYLSSGRNASSATKRKKGKRIGFGIYYFENEGNRPKPLSPEKKT